MADETQLGIGIYARGGDIAATQIRQLQKEIASLNREMQSLATNPLNNTGGMGYIGAALQKEIDKRRELTQTIIAQLAAQKALEDAMRRSPFNVASSQRMGVGQFFTTQELTQVHAHLKNLREDIAQTWQAAAKLPQGLAFRSLSQDIARSVGAGVDRQISSAASSARTLATSLSAAASADAYRRDEEAKVMAIQREVQAWHQAIAARNEAQVAMASNKQALIDGAAAMERAENAARGGARGYQDLINSVTGAGRAITTMTEAELAAQSAFNKSSMRQRFEGMFGGQGGFWRGGRTGMSLTDELARGQRGQAFSTFGAGLRASGVGGAGFAAMVVPVAVTAGIAELSTKFGELALKTQNAAAAAGMSVGQYSLLQREMQLLSGSSETLDRILGLLSSKMEEALADPASKARTAFVNLGISGDQLAEGLTHPMQMIEQLRQAWQRMASQPGLRTGLFHDVLGRQFEELVPYLRMTDEEMKNLQATAQSTGSVMSDDVGQKLSETGRKANELTESVAGLGQALANLSNDTGVLDFFISLAKGAGDAANALHHGALAVKKMEEDQARHPGIFSGYPMVGLVYTPGLEQHGASGDIPGVSPIMGWAGKVGDDSKLPAILQTQYNPVGLHKEMSQKLKEENDRNEIEKKELSLRIAEAKGPTGKQNPAQIKSLEDQRVEAERKSAQNVIDIHETYAKRAEHFHAPDDVVTSLREGEVGAKGRILDAQREQVEMNNRLERPTHSSLARRDVEAEERRREEERRDNIQNITRGGRLQISQEQDRLVREKGPADIAYGYAERRFGTQSPQARTADASRENILRQSETNRRGIYDTELAALKQQEMRDKQAKDQGEASKPAGMDSAQYENYVTQLKRAYDEDKENYQQVLREKQDMLNSSMQRQYQIQIQINESIAAQQHKDQQEYVGDWANAFNAIGSQAEDAIGQALRAAFVPMKPEYWYSTKSGPGGQPLMEAHRISPFAQIGGSLATSMAMDLGKALMGTITKSIAKSIFGDSVGSMGEGLAKMIIGPKGLFGSGLGEVAQTATGTASTAASSTTLMTASTTLMTGATTLDTAGVGLTTSAGALSAAAAALSASAATSGLSGLAQGTGQPLGALSELSAFALRGGGIIPSAARGLKLGSFGGGMLLMLHEREMVLPAHLSEGMQNMIENGGGGGHFHAHFHGPADRPAMEAWFKKNMMRNSGAVKQMFKSGALTPRSLST